MHRHTHHIHTTHRNPKERGIQRRTHTQQNQLAIHTEKLRHSILTCTLTPVKGGPKNRTQLLLPLLRMQQNIRTRKQSCDTLREGMLYVRRFCRG